MSPRYEVHGPHAREQQNRRWSLWDNLNTRAVAHRETRAEVRDLKHKLERGDVTVTATPPPPRRREKATTPIHALVPPAMGHAFRLWADSRGLTVSGAVRALMVHAMTAEVSETPVGPLSRDLAPDETDRIVAHLRDRRGGSTAYASG